MRFQTPTEPQQSTTEPSTDTHGRVVKIVLPTRFVIAALLGAVAVTLGGMFILLESAFARWAPWVGTEGMGALVTIVWGHEMLPVVRRERPIGSGIARAFAVAAATALGIAGAFYFV